MSTSKFIFLCCFALGCSAYDPAALDDETGRDDAGLGSGSRVDAGGLPEGGAAAGSGMPAADGGNAGSGGTGRTDMDASVGVDASHSGCMPNPDTLDEVCPEICPETCNAQDDDCDRHIDEDETLCDVAHTGALCSKGVCLIAECLDDYRDCNGKAADGCEVSPSDPKHCGTCKHACDLLNASATCVQGVCKVAACEVGHGDCDQDGESCETELDTVQDCGGCASTGDNVACLSLPNATTECGKGVCEVASCIGNFGDCDKDHKSCETELNVEDHCGSCTAQCDLPGTEASCATGNCLATTCKPGFDECTGGPSNGCESLSTLQSCGDCGKRCGPNPDTEADNHVVAATCPSQTCTITECDDGYADCDDDAFNGCETTTNTEQHCGDCDVTCDSDDFPNSDVSCATGSCEFVGCKDGYGDCSGGSADGCETKLDVLAHCGSCDNDCDPGQFCTGGTCSDLDCSSPPHDDDCAGSKCADCDADGIDCERDVASDTSNCQACDNQCAFYAGPTPVGTLVCTATGCGVSCPSDYADCDKDYRNGCEKSLKTLESCGSCGMGCSIPNATATCASGACRVQQCATDYDDCNDDDVSCETSLASPATCGSCTTACSAPNAISACSGTPGSRACSIGACTQSYFKDCNLQAMDGCEIDSRSDSEHCGACDNDCAEQPNVATATCSSSACAIDTCDFGFDDCSPLAGCETPVNTAMRCGSCNNNCNTALAHTSATSCDPDTLTCKVTTCATGYANCDGIESNGCETDTRTLADCGGCSNMGLNTVCTGLAHVATSSCSTGACVIQTCDTGFVSCDEAVGNGCEVDTRSDASNCGLCDLDCTEQPNVATASCSSSACVLGTCDFGWGDCSIGLGCETQVNTTTRCGACNTNCNTALAHTSVTSCDAGTLTCKITTCAIGYASCDNSDANGCETDTRTLANCGGCANMAMNTVCSALPNVMTSTCGSGACVIQACSGGFLDCDQNVANGCERDGNTLGPCTPDTSCTLKPFGGHDYYFCQNDSTWTAARNKCRLQLGGDLVQIDSLVENTFVQGSLTTNANAWIGASDSDVEGVFERSADGVPFWKNGASVLGAYANWNTGEPNASSSADDCVEMYASGASASKWNDAACSVAKDFVCEVAPDACTGDASKWLPGQCGCSVPDTDADADGFAACNDGCESDAAKISEGVCGCGELESSCGPGGDCTYKSYGGMSSTGYYVCSFQRSWDNARDVCQSLEGADLVRIDDVTEDTFVKASISANSWIGASDSAVESQWRWADDAGLFWSGNGGGSAQNSRYAHWSTTASQPEGGANADCAMWWSSNGGGWADESCSTTYPFVCEVPADTCPSSPKLEPGQCGCALADTDSDLDGIADCDDECPDDPDLDAAGDCGCPSDPEADGTLCSDGLCAASTQCDDGRCGSITQCFAENVNISMGHYHACARSDAGKAYCWGYNGNGRLGDGTSVERRGPVEVLGLSDVRELAGGESHTCAIVGSGELYCWGNAAASRLGTGNATSQSLPTKIAGITTAVQLAVGSYHSCVVLQNGTVQCWGNGADGRLGDNATADNTTPSAVSNLSDAVQVACGGDFSCARKTGGTVVCWGNGANGRLGNNATGDQLVPVAVSTLTNVLQVSAGTAHACAIVAGGQAYCWGYGANGRLGNNATGDQLTPAAVSGLTTAVQIEAGDNYSCAVRADDSAVCWGYNANGRLGTGNTTQSLVPVAVSGGLAFSRISAGLDTTCGLGTDGTAHCFGYGIYGIVGDGTNDERQAPNTVSVAFGHAQGVSAGYLHSCGVDEAGALRCFGDDTYSQLGDGGTTTDHWTTVAPTALANVTQVSAGEWHTCALTGAGDVYCWGVNTNGRLGLGDTTTRTTPVKVNLGGVATQVSTAYDTTCAVLTGGSIKCWGFDDNGQLGDGGFNVSFSVPVNVFGMSTGVEVRAGFRHTCARLSSGAVQCWGYNGYGQLGDNSVVAKGVPTTVMGLSNAVALAVSSYHSCAIVSGGQVMCWGLNDLGQLGDGTTGDRRVPTAVSGLHDAVEISTFYKHTCAVRENGSVACWGYNGNGRLGSGSTTNSNLPTTVVGITDAEHVAVGYHHTCATLRSGGMRCWGYGVEGQLGHGNNEERQLASPVQGLPK